MVDALARYRQLFETMPDGALFQSPDGVITDVNRALERMFDRSRDDLTRLTGRELTSRMRREDGSPISPEGSPLEIARCSGRAVEGALLGLEDPRRPGLRWLEVSAVPVDTGSEGGPPFAVWATVRDVTARRTREDLERAHAEEERERFTARLVQSRKMEAIGRLAGGIAHDFNNMLGVILGYSDLMLDEPELTPTLREDLSEVRSAAARCAELTRQLLVFAQKQTIAPVALDLAEVCRKTVRVFRGQLAHDGELELSTPDEPCPVKMDPAQAGELLVALVTKARDALGGTPHIRVATSNVELAQDEAAELAVAPGPYVLLEVRHAGPAVAPETLPHLFEPFFTTKEGRGTGLGIPMVYGIVQQNHGAIRVDSLEADGTVFRLWFPRVAPTPAMAPRPASSSSRVATILVVEDEPQILRIVKTLLTRRGYDVLATESPLEAIELCKRSAAPIDLLLTDVVMPEMNGKELHARLEAEKLGTKVLFMSGYTADVIEHRGVLPRGVHFLQKPFLPDELARRVREALD